MEYVPGSELVPGMNYHITLLWSSDSELDQGDHITEIWSSASDTDETPAPAQVHQSPVGIPPHNWSLESDTDEAPAPAPGPTDMQHMAEDWSSADCDHSSMDDQYTENSQLVISPSRITLDSSRFIPLDLEPSFSPSDDQVPVSTSYSLASTPLHTYAANDFAYLQDHMFEDELSEED